MTTVTMTTVTMDERCSCGAAWQRLYHPYNHQLVLIRCERGHEPCDLLKENQLLRHPRFV